MQRYAARSYNSPLGILKRDPTSDENQVKMDSPIASLVRYDGHVFLCIGEVNDITVDNHHTGHVAVEYLTEPSVFISYQVLFIVPAKVEDDPGLKHNWQWSVPHIELLVVLFNPSIQAYQHR